MKKNSTIPDILFITGIGTDVGKSFATGWLAKEIISKGETCITQKLIQTGNTDKSEDIEVHRKIMNTGYFPEDKNNTTAPEIFSYPCSPDLASRIDKRAINFAKIDKATRILSSRYDHVLIEGAGGLMVPLKGRFLTADYIASRKLHCVLVISGILGSINHSLLTLNAIKDYEIPLYAVIYNPFFDKDKVIADDTRKYIRSWLKKYFPKTKWLEMPEKLTIPSDLEDFWLSIPKTDLKDLPAKQLKGKISVIDNDNDLKSAVKHLKKASLIGIDTETKPAFHKGQSHKISLLQMSTPGKSFLFRIQMLSDISPLIAIIEDPNIKKIGLSLHDDFLRLKEITPFNPANIVELQDYVKKFRILDNSLTRIHSIIFGKKISKAQRLTNWEAPVLSEAQKAYAALDAMACLDIYRHLESGKFNPANSKYIVVPTEDEDDNMSNESEEGSSPEL